YGVVACLPELLATAMDGLLCFVVEVAGEVAVGGVAGKGEQRDDEFTREGLLALNAAGQFLIHARELRLLLFGDAGAEDDGQVGTEDDGEAGPVEDGAKTEPLVADHLGAFPWFGAGVREPERRHAGLGEWGAGVGSD